MIQIIDTSGVLHPLSNYERFHITHKQDGNDICSFTLDTSLPEFELIREEAVIRTYENEYLIKKIDDDKVDCKLNFDFLKQRLYKDYVSETKSRYQPCRARLSGRISRLTKGRIRETPRKSKRVWIRIKTISTTKKRRSRLGKMMRSFAKRDFCSINAPPDDQDGLIIAQAGGACQITCPLEKKSSPSPGRRRPPP